jgi:hypothetical protein
MCQRNFNRKPIDVYRLIMSSSVCGATERPKLLPASLQNASTFKRGSETINVNQTPKGNRYYTQRMQSQTSEPWPVKMWEVELERKLLHKHLLRFLGGRFLLFPVFPQQVVLYNCASFTSSRFWILRKVGKFIRNSHDNINSLIYKVLGYFRHRTTTVIELKGQL